MFSIYKLQKRIAMIDYLSFRPYIAQKQRWPCCLTLDKIITYMHFHVVQRRERYITTFTNSCKLWIEAQTNRGPLEPQVYKLPKYDLINLFNLVPSTENFRTILCREQLTVLVNINIEIRNVKYKMSPKVSWAWTHL